MTDDEIAALKAADALAKEWRATMPTDVMVLWGKDAANTIAALLAERERLREALREIEAMCADFEGRANIAMTARAALEPRA